MYKTGYMYETLYIDKFNIKDIVLPLISFCGNIGKTRRDR